MQIKVLSEETSYTRTIPFELIQNGETFYGTVTEFCTSVGGFDDYSYELDWEGDPPEDLNEDEIVDKVIKALKGRL